METTTDRQHPRCDACAERIERGKEDALHTRMVICALCILVPLAVMTALVSP
jgi:uncharacterized protein (DUF983 family)